MVRRSQPGFNGEDAAAAGVGVSPPLTRRDSFQETVSSVNCYRKVFISTSVGIAYRGPFPSEEGTASQVYLNAKTGIWP